jgi:hypothetical protein
MPGAAVSQLQHGDKVAPRQHDSGRGAGCAVHPPTGFLCRHGQRRWRRTTNFIAQPWPPSGSSPGNCVAGVRSVAPARWHWIHGTLNGGHRSIRSGFDGEPIGLLRTHGARLEPAEPPYSAEPGISSVVNSGEELGT